MQDGSRGTYRGLYICTDSFTLADVKRLAGYLTERYDIRCSVHKSNGNHRVYILAKSVQTVRDLVLPYMHDSKRYLVSLKKPTAVNKLPQAALSSASLSIHSKPNHKRSFATVSHHKLEPYFTTGFCDGESSFSISLVKRSASKAG